MNEYLVDYHSVDSDPASASSDEKEGDSLKINEPIKNWK